MKITKYEFILSIFMRLDAELVQFMEKLDSLSIKFIDLA